MRNDLFGIKIPVFSKGFARIKDPEKYISEKYGEGFIKSEERRIDGFEPLSMNDYNLKKHCVITSIASIFYYYSKIGFIDFSGNVDRIFEEVYLYAKRHGLYFQFYGVNLFVIPLIIKGLFKKFKVRGNSRNYFGLFGSKLLEEISQTEIISLRPFLLSFAGGDYPNHTTVCYGYEDYIRNGEKVRLLILADNWTVDARYADLYPLGSIKTAYYTITTAFIY